MGGLSIRRGIALFLLALAVRLVLIFALGSYKHEEGSEVINVAVSLAQTGNFADAYGVGSGPTAHVSPAYPILLSLIFRVLGTGQAGEIGQEIFSSAIASVSCALLPVLAIAFGMGARVGLWAGLWAALVPVSFWPQTKGSFEGALASLCLVLIFLYFARTWTHGRFTLTEALVGGVCSGLSLLVTPSVLPVLFLLLVFGAWLFRGQLSVYLRYAALFAGVTVLILLPWALRNQRVLGSLIFGRSNLGLELTISNNDQADAETYVNADRGLLDKYHPFLNPVARDYVKTRGEVAFQQERLKEAKAWILAHPQRFLELTAKRFALFWFPRMKRFPQTIVVRLEVLLGLIGYAFLLRTRSLARWLIAALWLGFPCVYYLVQAFPRYSYPMEWSFAILGAFAIATLLKMTDSKQLAV